MTNEKDTNSNPSQDPSKYHRIERVVVIGDIVKDEVSIKTGLDSYTREFDGGAFFVKRLLQSGLYELYKEDIELKKKELIDELNKLNGEHNGQDKNIELKKNELNDELNKLEELRIRITVDGYENEASSERNISSIRSYKTSLNLHLYPELLQGINNDNKVYRVKSSEAHHIDARPTQNVAERIRFSLPDLKSDFQMLVIKDLGIGFKEKNNQDQDKPNILLRRKPEGFGSEYSNALEWEEYVTNLFSSSSDDKQSFVPKLFVMIGHIPNELSEINNNNNGFYGKLLSEKTKYKDKTLAIVHADILRLEDLNIGKRISIEKTVQDYLSELHTNPTLKKLGEFQHLIINFDLLAAVHSYRIEDRRFHRLFFDPVNIYKPNYIFRSNGIVTGNQSVFITCIIRELIQYVNQDSNHRFNAYGLTEKIGDGVKKAIHICRIRYEKGFGNESDRRVNVSTALNFMDFNEDTPEVTYKDSSNSFNKMQFTNEQFNNDKIKLGQEIGDERVPVALPSWSILMQSAEYQLLSVAENIVKHGVEKAVNNFRDEDSSHHKKHKKHKKTVWSPLGKFGKKQDLIVLERNELESYRSVQRLMEQAMNDDKKDGKKRNILSIAVFGPPGAGKSFSSERIAESAADSTGKSLIFKKINLASLNELGQLYQKLDDIKNQSDYGRDNHILVIFFDEFDSSLGEKNLGWLKYFLPIMQDGEITSNWTLRKDESKPIFIFAGGTSHNYLDFSREDLSIQAEEKAKFAMAKGPDFVSRLKGHIDILGPNKVSEYDEAYVVRRAILLRTYFKSVLKVDQYNDKDWASSSVIRAMLTVSRYKHGARSMQAIIEMCITMVGDQIKSASLPTPSQLNMHVDATEFLGRVNSARLEIRAIEQEKDKTSE